VLSSNSSSLSQPSSLFFFSLPSTNLFHPTFCHRSAIHLNFFTSSNPTHRISDDSDDDECDDDDDPEVSNFNRSKRYLLSTSLDVDPRVPYKSELRGLPPGLASRTVPPKQSRAQDHQTILVTSMLMGSGDGRESKVRIHSAARVLKSFTFTLTKSSVSPTLPSCYHHCANLVLFFCIFIIFISFLLFLLPFVSSFYHDISLITFN
jgi:hypothetical protein